MYKKVTSDMNFIPREEEVLKFWKENEIFKKSQAAAEGKPEWTFYDGPPTANGKPHIGHILTRCIKDLFPRYKSMKGYNVLRKAGWDTHGLPVELEVEKQLGLDGKEQIEEYGIEPFIKKCKESVWQYKGEWERMSDRVGYWADMEDPYITYDNNYIESVWWSLKQHFDKGLLYQGHKIVPYCPRCGTALSSHEVAQGYHDVTETSVYVKFRKKGESNIYFLAWTTTPWTLPSNLALCVNANEEYCLVRSGDDLLYMAKALSASLIGEDAEITETMMGRDLEGMEYEPLFDIEYPEGKKHYIVSDDYVTLTDGSGIVHIAPAFGEDDYRIGRTYGLPFAQFVKPDGTMSDETPFAGIFVKKADPLIIEDLEKRGLLFRTMKFTHSYPFCWRCDTPLIYYARSSWFIRMTELRDNLIKNNRSVNWMPDNIKEGRMGNFLENVIDWGISRERYWGTPLPIWKCECGHVHCIGSIEELRRMGKDVPEDIELHRPYIDEVKLICPECGKEMKRVPEVIDCWYDSGSMPFAQWHYPFENKEEFEKRFPANFISEAVDQTRGWFYTLMAISTLLFDRSPFENCIVLGHVQDKNGKKMSKHLGNVIDPWQVLDVQGADAVRWYFYSNSAPWLPNRFYPEAVSESQRKFMGMLWNTYAFYILYADIDNFDPTKYELRKDLGVLDRWILSKLNSLIKDVSENLDAFRIAEASRSLSSFVDELSNWYVRRGRERYWGSEMTQDKIDAYMTLYTVLETLSKVCAPFVPFMTESIYQNLVRTVDKDAPISVHLCAYPEADESRIDVDLENSMEAVLKVVTLGRACRNDAQIKNRQPISRLFVAGISELHENFTEVIRGELNVKEVIFGAEAEQFINYNVKPQLRTLGPKYGKLLGAIRNHLATANGTEIVKATENGGLYSFEANGTTVELSSSDILVEPIKKPGFSVQSEGDTAVIIDTELTPELIEEGIVRETISKIQTMRKEAGFNVTDHISLYIKGNSYVEEIAEKYAATVKKETLADSMSVSEGFDGAYEKDWDINGYDAVFGVKVI